MIIVLDASAAIEIALKLEMAEKFKNILHEAELVIAPDTFPSEVTNVFWKYSSISGLDEKKCEKGIDYCIDLIDDFIETKSICREVYGEAVKYEHPVYDVFYLVLARRHNAGLLTKDKKMKKIAKEMKIEISEKG